MLKHFAGRFCFFSMRGICMYDYDVCGGMDMDLFSSWIVWTGRMEVWRIQGVDGWSSVILLLGRGSPFFLPLSSSPLFELYSISLNTYVQLFVVLFLILFLHLAFSLSFSLSSPFK
jgi:hypothetical protein